MPSPEKEELFNQYNSQLRELRDGLPNSFSATLDSLINRLPDLFTDDWPLMPNHADLLENNIHVDPMTGRLVGICDWRDMTISPFGMSLGGLETMLGINWRRQGWCYHSNQQELRELFWQTFTDAMGAASPEQAQRITNARIIGLFLAHGFEVDGSGNRFPAKDGQGELPYLEAITLGLEGLSSH